MALVKAAFAAIRPITFHRKAATSSNGCTNTLSFSRASTSMKRLPRGRAFTVSDFTATEWCEKQKEFDLLFGKHELTKAMKAGKARHVALEEEVMPIVKSHVKSAEDVWARKFIKFIFGANQLLRDGLTRELPVICGADGVWISGVVDEIRMPLSRSSKFPILVDTKTRVQATLPGEPQRRNGRYQLMFYKLMWDILVAGNFSSQEFVDYFSLSPNHLLSPENREYTENLGFPSQIFNDLMIHFGNTCRLLPRADNQLLLRYELQEDQSLIGEEQFAFDHEWVNDQIKSCLGILLGEREARYAPQEERWKCKYCKFKSICPALSYKRNHENSEVNPS